MELAGKVVLITGASRGLGRELARQLAKRGAHIALVARNAEPLDEVVARIRAEGGVAVAFSADVGDKRAVHPLAAQVAETLGPVDILVNNASTLGPTPLRWLLDTECEDFERVLQTNLVGPFRLTKIVAGAMAVRGGGIVVNLSSDAAVEAYPRWGAYGVSKAALAHLTKSFAAELTGTGVRFVSFDPGEMNTKMHADAVPNADVALLADPADVAGSLIAILEGGQS